MSYSQSYVGSFTFADAHCLEAGIDEFAAAAAQSAEYDEESCIELDDLQIDDLVVSVSWNGSAPASCSFGAKSALSGLGSHARSGRIATTFELDGISRETVTAGGRRSSKGLPPQHHGWELFFAAKQGDAKALRSLHQRGVTFVRTYPTQQNFTPLHLAVESGSIEAIRVCLDAGCAIDAASGWGTPLMRATTAAVANALIAAGADVNATSGDDSVLSNACERDRRDVVEALLDANVEIRKRDHETIVQRCAWRAWLDILHRLLKREPSIAKVLAKAEVVERAIDGGEPVLLDLLLDHGAKLPKNFLELAVESKSIPLAEMALRAPGALKKNAFERMRSAAFRCDLPMMKLLAEHGAPVDDGSLSILHTIGGDESEVTPAIDWLLARGLEVDRANDKGETPLEWAIRGGREFTALHLLARGADPSVVDKCEASDVAYIAEKLGARWTKALAASRKASRSKPPRSVAEVPKSRAASSKPRSRRR